MTFAALVALNPVIFPECHAAGQCHLLKSLLSEAMKDPVLRMFVRIWGLIIFRSRAELCWAEQEALSWNFSHSLICGVGVDWTIALNMLAGKQCLFIHTVFSTCGLVRPAALGGVGLNRKVGLTKQLFFMWEMMEKKTVGHYCSKLLSFVRHTIVSIISIYDFTTWVSHIEVYVWLYFAI
jgi:hypothetical protein